MGFVVLYRRYNGLSTLLECSFLVIVTRLIWFQFGVDPGECYTCGFCGFGFMLDLGTGLLDFPGLEFCWSQWPGWMCYVLSNWCSLGDIESACLWVGPHLGGGWFQVLVWTQVSTALGDFVTKVAVSVTYHTYFPRMGWVCKRPIPPQIGDHRLLV